MSGKVLDKYRELVKQSENRLQGACNTEVIRIQVGNATCENAAGSRDVYDEFKKHLLASGRQDICLQQTGCTGRCSSEPIVGITIPGKATIKYQMVDRAKAHAIFTSHVLNGQPVTDLILDAQPDVRSKYEFFFCQSILCEKCRMKDFRKIFSEKLKAAQVPSNKVRVIESNCFGLCQVEKAGESAYIMVLPSKVVYRITTEKDLDQILNTHIKKGKIVESLRIVQDEPMSQRFFELYGDVAFFNRQSRIALRNAGIINPESFEEHVHVGGFEALARILDSGDRDWLLKEITESKLRGRGGGGYPTGLKWTNAASSKESEKYIICNADEGDPGAFMDRSMLESDPFSVVEGIIIGGYAIGASQGFIYVRAEYPLAIKRLQNAMDRLKENGLLGENILGSSFNFDMEIRLGAGAFVCGEETSLIHSIEGRRGEPRIRPPYPSTRGLWGKPTVINNVETFANVPVIIEYGAEWFRQMGTEKSGGTKVFALAGKVKQTGLVEVPMGTTLRQIVFDIGGGIPHGKGIKAIQTGGPAGGCLPAKWLDTPVDFDTLAKAGSIMGSGGMIVMDQDDCMVDIAKYFMKFSQDESCGKCTPCREGTKRMLEILEKITSGNGSVEDLDKLERLGNLLRKASLCGLGRAAANPVLSTLVHYRDEYEKHVIDRKCPAGKCRALVQFIIDTDKCVGCTVCARNCPVSCIAGEPKKVHEIDQTRCIKCGKCYEVCRFNAVIRE